MCAFAAALPGGVAAGQTDLPSPNDPDKVVSIKQPVVKTGIDFEGNVVIADAALLETTGLAYGSKPTADEMITVIRALYAFYRRAGYDLVRLEYAATETGWAVYIDEGLLAEIRIFGLGWYDTFALRSSLLLDGIYNRKQLEERLAEWLKRDGIASVSYEMVRKKRALDLASNEFIAEISRLLKRKETIRRLKSQWGTQLRIYIEHSPQYDSFNPGFGYSSDNGFELDGLYRAESWLAKRDKLEVYGLVGINELSTIDPASTADYTYFNLYGEIKWFTPPLRSRRLRLFVESDASVVHRQRPDLPLDHFQLLRLEETLNLNIVFRRRHTLRFLAGYEHQRVFDVTGVAGTPFALGDDRTHAALVGSELSMRFGDLQNYKELNHVAKLGYKHRFRADSSQLDLLQATYNRSFQFNYLDFLTRTSGTLLLGDAEFYDEYPLEELGMRTNFDRRFSVKKSLNHRQDLRLNLYERQLQAGPFQDMALFGKIDHATGVEELAFAYAAGPAIYCVFWDAFQLYTNIAFGVTTDSDASWDFHIGIEKLFE